MAQLAEHEQIDVTDTIGNADLPAESGLLARMLTTSPALTTGILRPAQMMQRAAPIAKWLLP